MIGSHLLLDRQKAASQHVEEDAEVLGLVDLALRAAGLAVCHQSGDGLEVLEARGALHAFDAVGFQDMFVQLGSVLERLPVVC